MPKTIDTFSSNSLKILDKSLLDFQNKYIYKLSFFKKEERTILGEKFHSLICAYLNDIPTEKMVFDLDNDKKNIWNRLQIYLKDKKDHFCYSEYPFLIKEKLKEKFYYLIGRIDAIFKEDDFYTIYDWKTLNLPEKPEEEADDGTLTVAVIGKPNAGKSSIINRMVGDKRLIVSDIAGTTRDAVDTRVENAYGVFNFIDTAGIRRRSKVEDRIEKFSVLRAHMAVERADVCILLIDGSEGITEQDEHIAGIAHDAGKCVIIAVNKWDLIEKDNNTVKEFTDRIRTALAYMPYAPIVFLSALTGQRVTNLYQLITEVYAEARKRVTTGVLNDLLNDAMTRVQPPSDKGRRLKIYYMTQSAVTPPTFVIFCNSAELFHFSYQRYIENCLRETFGFKGTPVKIVVRQRGEKDGGV